MKHLFLYFPLAAIILCNGCSNQEEQVVPTTSPKTEITLVETGFPELSKKQRAKLMAESKVMSRLVLPEFMIKLKDPEEFLIGMVVDVAAIPGIG